MGAVFQNSAAYFASMKRMLPLILVCFLLVSGIELKAQSASLKESFVEVNPTAPLPLGINHKPLKIRFTQDSFKQIPAGLLTKHLPDSLKEFKWGYITFSDAKHRFYVVFNGVSFMHKAMLLTFDQGSSKLKSALLIEEASLGESKEYDFRSELQRKGSQWTVTSTQKDGFTYRCKKMCLCTEYDQVVYTRHLTSGKSAFTLADKQEKKFKHEDCDDLWK